MALIRDEQDLSENYNIFSILKGRKTFLKFDTEGLTQNTLVKDDCGPCI